MYSNNEYESTLDTNTYFTNLTKDVKYKSTQYKQKNSISLLCDKRFIIYIIYYHVYLLYFFFTYIHIFVFKLKSNCSK